MGGFSGVIGQLDDLAGESLDSVLALPRTRGASQEIRESWLALRMYRRNHEAAWSFDNSWIAVLYGYVAEFAGDGAPVSSAAPLHDSARHLLELYREYGSAAFAWARGQWSAVLVDRLHQTIIFARDYPGTRPLFWRRGAGRIWFSTEPRPLWNIDGRCTPNLSQLAAFAGGYPPIDQTVVKEVRRFEPGTTSRMSFEEVLDNRACPGEVAIPHWEPPCTRKRRFSPQQAATELTSRLASAVRRAVPPGPFGVAFSGGLDSSVVLALATMFAGHEARKRVVPLSLRFPNTPRCDEGMFIKPVVQALGLEAIEIEIGGPLELDDLRALYRLVHSPVFPNVPLFARLVKKAGMSGLPAVLTGMGGDHLLDGHPIAIVDLLGSGRWRHGLSLAQKLWMNDEVWSPRLARHVFRGVCRRVRSAGDVKRNRERSEAGARPSLGFEGMTILSSIERESRLFHLDAQAELSESFGVEVRDPLFDRDLIDFVLLLDPGLLMLGGYRRGLVRSCLGKLLPKGVATREGKTDLSDVSAPVWEQWYETRQSQRANLSCWTRLVDFDRAIGSYRPGFVRDVATLEVFAETKFTGVK